MFINLFKSAVTDEAERIEVKSHTRIKDIPELKGLDFLHVLIFVNGFQKNENYILREKDVCTIRCFPSNMSPEKIVANILTGGALMITEEIAKVTANVTLQIADATIQVTEKLTKLTQDMISNALGGIKKYDYENYIDQRSYDYSTKITQNIISADNVVKSPNMRGCMNQLETGSTYPLVIGKSYFVPRMCAKPYITPSGELGYYQTYHALYDLGYNTVNVTDICLGLKKLATNSAKQRNGAITIDGDYDPAKFDIHLEVQESQEVSLYDQMVVQQDINAELMFPKPAQGEQPRNFIYDGISTPYPQKVELEFYLEGLVGKVAEGDNKGKDCDGTVKIKCEYSTDGGVTFLPFGQVGSGSGISYNSSTGETTITMKNYHSMRFVATKVFSASEVFNATNHVVELRIQRTNVHDEDLYIYDTVSLASVRTYTYDPKLSTSSNLVKQSPVCEKDRQRITRLGVTITSNERLYNLGELNCIVQALGRTCTESNGYYTWSNELSETCNPASMALRVLQCGMLGEYIYNDSEIDMQKFGELYKFCDEYDIRDVQGKHVGICANGVVTKQTKLSELLSKILAVGRASRIIRVGKLSLYIDKPIEYTSLILNNQNVLSASNSKNFDELPSGIRAEFVNEDNFNQEDVMFIDYSDAPPRESIQYKTVGKKYEFQTNVEQIKKNALYDLAVLKLRPESWNRKVTSEGCLAFIGAKIEVQDDTIAVGIGDGAEIKDIILDANEEYITGIKTDGEFDVTDTTKEYGVRIQVATIEYGLKYITRKVVVEQEGVYRNFTFDSPISLDELILPASGDILSFGILGKISYESICIGKKADSDGTFELTLVPYVPEIYTADGGQLPEFESNTTAPNYYTPPEQKLPLTQEDLQSVKNDVIDIENGTAQIEPPDAPTSLRAIAQENGIQVIWNPIQNNGLKNCLKCYVVEISNDSGTTWTEVIKTYNSDYFYTFQRTGTGADGYPERSVFSTWQFRVKAENIYDKSSLYTTNAVDASSYGTWLPSHCTVVSPKANKDGFLVTWTKNSTNYGTDVYRVKVYDGVTLLQISPFIKETYYEYKFDRSIDGYPEKSSYSNTRNLNNYTVVIEHSNESNATPAEDSAYVNTDSYGTWRIGTFTTANVSKEVIDRTAILGFNLPTGSLELYGDTRFKVSIKRTGIDAVHEGNTNYPDFTPDTNWYKPDLYSNPLTSESNYKTDVVDGYEVSSRRFSQTLPLVGQSSNNIVNTIYEYKVSAYNESGYETASITISVTALCTSLRDIVKANADYKDLYVEKLSAISANIGLIAQGGMGDFASNSNYWALSTLFPEDTGLERTVHEGEFRVGDSDSYIKVSYDEHGNATVEFSTDAFTVRAENTEFNKSIIIQENPDSLDRTRLTPIGTYYEHRNTVNSNWVVISKIDTAGARTSNVFTDDTMIITNASMKQRRSNGSDLGLPLLSDSLVYHFDDDMFDQYGFDSLTITGETGGIQPRLVGIEDVSTSQSITNFIPALQAVAPFATSAKSLYGNASVSKILSTRNTFTVEFWIKHSWNESQKLFVLGNTEQYLEMHLVNAESYYNEPASGEVPYNEATIESEVTPYNEIIDAYAKLEYFDGDEITIYDLRDYDIEYEKDRWFHLAVILNNGEFKFIIDNTDITITQDLQYTDDVSLVINPTKGLFLLDELMISETAGTVEDIEENTVNKIPYGKLDYTRKHFILDVDNSDVWTNLFDTQIFKDKVLEVIREENSGS